MPELKEFENIAVIQTAFLGDVALSLYLTQNIKNINPEVNLIFVTTPLSATFVSCAKSVDKVISFDKRNLQSGLKGIKKISQQLDALKVDCIVAPHRSFRTALINFYSQRKFSVCFDKSVFSFLYSKRVKYRLGQHETIRNNSLLSAFDDTSDIIAEIPDVELEISNDDKLFIENLCIKNNINESQKLITIAPGSVWETKRWKIEYFDELCKKFISDGFKVVIIGSRKDKEFAIKMQSEIIDITGKTTLPQLLYLLKLSELVITNDSSPTHFAGLVKTPTLTIYGPTVPEFGFYPLGKNDLSVEIDNLKCRPCSIHGQKKCPIKHFSCMNLLKPDIVYKSAVDVIQNSKNG